MIYKTYNLNFIERVGSIMKNKAIIFNIKRYAIHDGPGIRTTVFFKGCPLNCSWCHNPESKSHKKELFYNQKKCINCFDCVDACNKDALSLVNNKLALKREKCTGCFDCVNVCFNNALQKAGKIYTVDELFNEINKDSVFHEESGGGITCSGGEPMMQIDFLEEFLKVCKNRKVHTAIDTSGYAESDNFKRILKYTDLFLYDIKFISETKHKKYTGLGNKKIINNLRLLKNNNASIRIRIPVIPDINGKDEINEIIKFVDKIGIKKVDVLPYHQAGINKEYRLGKQNVKKYKKPDRGYMESIQKKYKNSDITIQIGG